MSTTGENARRGAGFPAVTRLLGMTDGPRRDGADEVVCLSCRHVSEKPARGGLSSRNPGCPLCGYVGWLSALVVFPDRGSAYGGPTA